jgi:hypothetical protein
MKDRKLKAEYSEQKNGSVDSGNFWSSPTVFEVGHYRHSNERPRKQLDEEGRVETTVLTLKAGSHSLAQQFVVSSVEGKGRGHVL